jgi:hypothetical protein
MGYLLLLESLTLELRRAAHDEWVQAGGVEAQASVILDELEGARILGEAIMSGAQS